MAYRLARHRRASASQTHVAPEEAEILGYHTLVYGQVDYDDAPERLTKGLARHLPLLSR